jgi:hypothetical protein
MVLPSTQSERDVILVANLGPNMDILRARSTEYAYYMNALHRIPQIHAIVSAHEMSLSEFFDDRMRRKWVRQDVVPMRELFKRCANIIGGLSTRPHVLKIDHPCAWLTKGVSTPSSVNNILFTLFDQMVPPYDPNRNVEVISIRPSKNT